MDVGKDVRRNRGAVVKLADTVQGMMANWTENNFQQFEETMKLIKEGAPVQWVKLYMEAVKLGIEKNTNINININRQKDRDDLQALVRSRVSLPDTGTYVPYEEVTPEPLPLKQSEDD
jgi:phosphotransferase system HPr-like phosphotransfer protein